MQLASFDIEIASVIPDAAHDWSSMPNLGISCAAVAFSDSDEVTFWSGTPQMTQDEAQDLVHTLIDVNGAGYSLVTWNGCSFDFRVLADESGMHQECAELAMEHIDLMLMVTFTKGWYLSLQKALDGAGLRGKLKRVRLDDGSILDDMDGSKAPALWEEGEHEAVLSYLEEDVRQQLALAQFVLSDKRVQWVSNSGNPQIVPFDGLKTVRQCFDIAEPDTSWMTDPPTREQFIDWMP